MSGAEPKKVSIAEANRVVKEGLASGDSLRLSGLGNLGRFRVSKAKIQSRELNRLEQKHNKDSPVVIRANSKLVANTQYISGLKMEANRASAGQEKCDQRTWAARGRVYDRAGCPVAGASIALHRADGTRLDQISPVKTDVKGRYRLSYTASARKTSDAQAESAGEIPGIRTNLGGEDTAGDTESAGGETSGLRINTNQAQDSVFLRATYSGDDSLCSDSTLMLPELGKCNYRDLILNTDLSNKLVGDLGKDRRSSRYLGNSSTRELHDIKNEKTSCQIDSIRIDRCFRFKTIKEAQMLDYDFCAYCFGKERSKR